MLPARLLHIEVQGFLFALAAVLVYKMLTRSISLRGLLNGEEGGNISTERVQLLLATLAMGSQYIGEVSKTTGNTMPDVSRDWLYMFGGSSAIYMVMKTFKTFNVSKLFKQT